MPRFNLGKKDIKIRLIISRKRQAMHACLSIMIVTCLGMTIRAPQAWSAEKGVANLQGRSAADYWTPERMRRAKPMPLPQPLDPLPHAREMPSQEETVVGEDGRGPTVRSRPDEAQYLFAPVTPGAEDAENAATEPARLAPRNVGSVGAHFTSSRLVPLSADTVYPYRTVGKLFLTAPEGDLLCSAAVIKPRLILTAGHCVHNGKGLSISNYYKNFLFVPAFRDGKAPYGRWNWAYVLTTTTWKTGGGTFPNAADYALIEFQDNASNTRIGDVTGILGFQTNSLHPNHVHLLGYPVNLDGGNKMHQVTAESFQTAVPNAVEYGSDMTGGSSGGPWVQNFGARATGQTGGLNTGQNRVVGVTSYGRIAPEPKIQGSSILDSRFTGILNTMCAHRQGNC